MFTQEKQNLINNKDWDSLIKTDILSDFEINDTKKYVFDFDFIYEFVLKRFNENIVKLHYKINVNMLFVNTFVRAKELNLNITADQWELIIVEFIEIKKNDTLNFSISNGVFLNTKDKNSGFIKFLINCDNPELNKLYRGYQSDITLNSFNIDGISVNDIVKLVDKFDNIYKTENYFKVKFSFNDEIIEKLLNEIKTDEEIISFFKKSNTPLYSVFKLFSEDRFISFIRNNLDKITLSNVSHYVKTHKDMIFPDDLVKDIVETGKLYYFAPVLTLEQIEKHKDRIPTDLMIFNKKIPLDKVKELKSIKQFDASKIRFFTEEEIIQNPEFFDPESVKKVGYLYVSESTFKLLNKTWGKRQKYETKLTDFLSLYNNLSIIKYFSIDSLRYIVKKTGASNDIVVKEIINSYTKFTNKDYENFGFIKEFINSYTI